MARSYRRTPICGITKAASDKAFKKAAHKRASRAMSALDLRADDPPAEKAFGNLWSAPKDGKQWIDTKRFPEIMRK